MLLSNSFVGYLDTSNFVKNTPLRVAFSTLLSVFGYPDETLSRVFDIVAIFLCLEREGSKPQAGGDFKSPSEKVI